ncbi:MAG: 4-hydroxythreonine-4-phosphate dehydrogenase PdxA [candidate division WOR-3 bacterium]
MIGITLGDPAGIGAEVTCRALKQLEGIRAILIGSGSILQATASHLGIRLPSQVELRDFGPHRKIMPGRVQPEAARIALWSLQTAARMLRQGEISGVVTAPVSKLALLAAGFGFPGQTEFFAAQLGVRHHAMMAYVPSSAAWPKTLRIVNHCAGLDPEDSPTDLIPSALRGLLFTAHRSACSESPCPGVHLWC